MEEQTLACICKSMILLLEEKEYVKIQMKEIAEQAHVSRKTLYRYFDSKEQIIKYIAESLMYTRGINPLIYIWFILRKAGMTIVKTKRLLLLIMILLVSFSLYGCGSMNNKAKKAALEYIEEKYNNNAKIVKIKKNYKLEGPGGGLLPTGIKPDGSYNLVMEIDGRRFNVCLISDGSEYIGYDNYEKQLIRTEILEDVESSLGISCADLFLSYSELYGKYGTNLIHAPYSDLSSVYENGRFAAIIATYDSINSDDVEKYAAKYSVENEKSILRIEILQYRDVIPELGFSSFSEVNDPKYVLDWYTISNGSVTHHEY